MTALDPHFVSTSRLAEVAPNRRREAVRYHAMYLAFACIVLGLAAILQIEPRDKVVVPWLDLPLPESCIYRRIVSTGCPGCGLTRCFIALMDGKWGEAWAYNPAGFLAFSLLGAQLPYRVVQIRRVLRGRPELHHPRLSACMVVLLVLALFGQWLLRQFAV